MLVATTTAMAPLWPTHPRLNARFSTQDTTTMEAEFAQEEKVLFLQEGEIDEDEAGMESEEEEEFNVAIIEFQDNSENLIMILKENHTHGTTSGRKNKFEIC